MIMIAPVGSAAIKDVYDHCTSDGNDFGKPTSHYGGNLLYSDEEVEMAVRECLRIQDPDLCRSWNFKFVPRWDRCIIVAGIVLKYNKDIAVE